MDFLVFSFVQGVAAFFAPCAVTLLPGYITSYVSRGEGGGNAGEGARTSRRLVRGLQLALFSLLALFLVYAVAGGLIVVAGQLLKAYLKWVVVGMGVVLCVLGVLLLAGKHLSLNLNLRPGRTRSEAAEAFLFGAAYGLGALGCLFPLFLIVATQALAAPTVLEGARYLVAYFAGIGLMMVLAIGLATLARSWLQRTLRRILPHMERLTGVLLLLAGGYVIYYQMALI